MTSENRPKMTDNIFVFTRGWGEAEDPEIEILTRLLLNKKNIHRC